MAERIVIILRLVLGRTRMCVRQGLNQVLGLVLEDQIVNDVFLKNRILQILNNEKIYAPVSGVPAGT